MVSLTHLPSDHSTFCWKASNQTTQAGQHLNYNAINVKDASFIYTFQVDSLEWKRMKIVINGFSYDIGDLFCYIKEGRGKLAVALGCLGWCCSDISQRL